MKQTRFWLTTIVALLYNITASAHDFEAGGIYYNITDAASLTVAVTYQGSYDFDYSNEYSGAITILSTVTYNGNTYRVTSFGTQAFSGCSRLTSITIPGSVTSIGNYAFDGCTSLKEIVFENGSEPLKLGYNYSDYYPNHVGQGLFYECPLESVYLGRNLSYSSGMSYGYSPFYKLGRYPTISLGDGITSIGGYLFYGNSNLSSITIPEGVTSIGDHAFSGCSNLVSISIPKSVTGIVGSAFENCTGKLIVNCNIPSASHYVNAPFYNSKFTSVIVGDGVRFVGDKAFYQCESLLEIILPNSLSYIGSSAFVDCANLSSIHIPEGVASIKDFTFSGCANLTNIDLPEALDTIGKDAFSGCESLESVTIPDCVNYIGYSAFSGCSALTTVNIPRSLRDIKQATFLGCGGLVSIFIPKNIESIGPSVFSGCTSLKEVIFEDNIDNLVLSAKGQGAYGEGAFYDCPLEYVYIGRNLDYSTNTTSGYSPFYNKEFKEVSIGSMVSVLGENLFYFCSIETLRVLGATPPEIKSISYDILKNTLLEVQYGAKEFFLRNNLWKSFRNIKEVGDCYILQYVVDGELYATDSVAYEIPISLLELPGKEGYTFSGWSEAPEVMPANDVIISGRFIVNKYIVTFKVGDDIIATDSFEYGTAIVTPEVPEKEGHTFNGWSEVAETVPAHDLTYEGSYSINSYLLTYVVDGETVQADSVAYGTAITLLDEPVKEGYTFSGWSEAPETMPAHDVTISGTFTVNIYKVCYYVGEELVHTAEVAYAEAIPEYVYEPTKEGDIFNGWSGETYETMPAHDVVYMANITNGITPSTLNSQHSTIYDLAGRKVTNTENLKGGVYIVNGKKVVF